MNLIWLLLGLSEASCCLFERIWEGVKCELRPAIHMEKGLGKAESLGISKAGQTVLARLMESQLWHQLASFVGAGFRKGTMASARLDARCFSSSLYAIGAFQAATLVL